MIVLPPAEWTCFPAGVIPLPAAHAAKLYRFGLQRGWPDYLISHFGFFGIELKRPGSGRLSRSYTARTARGALVYRIGQEEMFPRLEGSGMRIAVCRDQADVVAALRGWGIPMRRIE